MALRLSALVRVREVHSLRWQHTFVAGIELVVVHQNQIHQFIAVIGRPEAISIWHADSSTMLSMNQMLVMPRTKLRNLLSDGGRDLFAFVHYGFLTAREHSARFRVA